MALRLKSFFQKRKADSASKKGQSQDGRAHLGFPQEVIRMPIEKKGWKKLIPGRIYRKVLSWSGTSRTSIPFLKSTFVGQNEKMMKVREQVLLDAKFPKEAVQRALHLFRLRKAARITSSTTGYCTRNVALALTNFLEEEMREQVKYAQLHPGTFGAKEKENIQTLGQMLTAVSKFSKTTNVKERMRMARLKKNDYMALRMEGADATELALNPNAKKTSRIVDLGPFIASYLQMVIDERVKKVVGQDYYDEIRTQEIAESRRRQME
jgi:hypothetical protein